jgi:hypothetical protein
MANDHSSQLHVGIDVDEADFHLPVLLAQNLRTPGGNHENEREGNRHQPLYR